MMSSDPTITPPPADIRTGEDLSAAQAMSPSSEVSRSPELAKGKGSLHHDPTTEPPKVRFSSRRWIFTGIVRLLYRFWTRIAAHLFPEDSWSERLALDLHIPLPDRLNMSWITDQLAVGGRIRPQDIKALAGTGITHVIDTRSEHRDDVDALANVQIDLLHLPTPDTQPFTLEQMMEGAKWANEAMQRGDRVLIHCEHGVGRSVLLTCATLIFDGMHAHDALELVKQKRWQASPNHRQVIRLREFEKMLAGKRSA